MSLAPRAGRRWFAPEVVQTSSMDCGPAALKCLLEGHGVPVSYGRLREACQTDVDGTSIDTLEQVANQLGLRAEQVLLPVDHVLQDGNAGLPALAVVRHVDAATHFVVVWRRVGRWLQVMDPAQGRRWVRADRFTDELYRHRMTVPAADWRAWAASEAFAAALCTRMAALGIRASQARSLHGGALARSGWRSVATLDAGVRLLQSLQAAGGVGTGSEAVRLLRALCRRSIEAADPQGPIPAAYWSVRAVPSKGAEQLELQGAVLLRTHGLGQPDAALPPLSSELAAALKEKPEPVLATVWRLLRHDGLVPPLALAGAVALAAGVVTLEALLFRGLFDIAALLGTASQRMAAVAALLGFVALLALLELPILGEALRQGRRLETRLRIALLAKLPRLNDRYFQSRPLSDMADRSHGLQITRGLPGLALQGVQALCTLLLTLGGLCWIAPASAGLAVALFAAALLLPLAVQPLLNERDLRARNHAAALNGFYLDALLGLVPVRAHRAERNVARQHESLLVEWAAAARSGLAIALAAEGVQALVCTALAGWLLASHFLRAGGIGGADLLLVFWTLRLPALGSRIAALAQQVPAQRNVLLRLLEPLGAAEEAPAASAPLAPLVAPVAAPAAPMSLSIQGGEVVAAGHAILRGIELEVRAGEHIAVVGSSGAGKSSLVGLLLGWHRLAAGRMQVDGHTHDASQVDALRRCTAWVDPAVQVWNRSFLDNLTYASEAPDLARTGDVLQAARLRGVLERLPQGLQNLLGEGGALLSGGEGQRVRLARALLASGTRLALLDEPFRGLDRAQRQALLAEARAWWRDTTLLCVTHDVGETRGFDRVLVVEGGRIVEDGAPAALAARPTRYRELLEAERRVQATLWQDHQWRRIGVEAGHLKEAA